VSLTMRRDLASDVSSLPFIGYSSSHRNLALELKHSVFTNLGQYQSKMKI